MATVYVEKEKVTHIRVLNTSGRALKQNEFVVIGSLCGVADINAAQNEPVSLHVEGMIEIQAGADDLTGAIANYTPGKVMYFNSSTGKFADAASVGFVKVGQIVDSNGTDTVRFAKFSAAGEGNGGSGAGADQPARDMAQQAQAAADNAQATADTHISDTGNPHNVTKAQVGLGNVNNTSDANKPVSTAQQNAIDAEKTRAETAEGTLAGLNTSSKTSLVDAINEVKSDTDGKVNLASVTTQVINSDIALDKGKGLFGTDGNGTEHILVKHSQYPAGQQTEVGSETDFMRLNHNALGWDGTAQPSGDNIPVNYKDTAGASQTDLIPYMAKDITPLKNTVDSLVMGGIKIGSFATKAQVPTVPSAAAWLKTPTVNDFFTVWADETQGGVRTQYYVSAADITNDTMTVALDGTFPLPGDPVILITDFQGNVLDTVIPADNEPHHIYWAAGTHGAPAAASGAGIAYRNGVWIGIMGISFGMWAGRIESTSVTVPNWDKAVSDVALSDYQDKNERVENLFNPDHDTYPTTQAVADGIEDAVNAIDFSPYEEVSNKDTVIPALPAAGHYPTTQAVKDAIDAISSSSPIRAAVLATSTMAAADLCNLIDMFTANTSRTITLSDTGAVRIYNLRRICHNQNLIIKGNSGITDLYLENVGLVLIQGFNGLNNLYIRGNSNITISSTNTCQSITVKENSKCYVASAPATGGFRFVNVDFTSEVYIYGSISNTADIKKTSGLQGRFIDNRSGIGNISQYNTTAASITIIPGQPPYICRYLTGSITCTTIDFALWSNGAFFINQSRLAYTVTLSDSQLIEMRRIDAEYPLTIMGSSSETDRSGCSIQFVKNLIFSNIKVVNTAVIEIILCDNIVFKDCPNLGQNVMFRDSRVVLDGSTVLTVNSTSTNSQITLLNTFTGTLNISSADRKKIFIIDQRNTDSQSSFTRKS